MALEGLALPSCPWELAEGFPWRGERGSCPVSVKEWSRGGRGVLAWRDPSWQGPASGRAGVLWLLFWLFAVIWGAEEAPARRQCFPWEPCSSGQRVGRILRGSGRALGSTARQAPDGRCRWEVFCCPCCESRRPGTWLLFVIIVISPRSLGNGDDLNTGGLAWVSNRLSAGGSCAR